MKGFLGTLALIGGVFGGLSILMTFVAADSAPQEAAGAALAAALAVIPYCLHDTWLRIKSGD